MALIKTSDEIRQHLQVAASFPVDALIPLCTFAERQHLVPALGEAFYEGFEAAYQAGTLSTQEQKLLPKLQAASVHLARLYHMDMNNVVHSADGMHQVNTDRQKPAWEWAVNKAQAAIAKVGFNAIDIALEYMVKNKAFFPTWTASDEYTQSKELFIPSAKVLTEHFAQVRQSRMLYTLIRPLLKSVQQFQIKPCLGNDFYDELLTAVQDGSVDDDQQPVLDLVRNAQTFLGLAKATPQFAVEFTVLGLINPFDSDRSTQKASESASKERLSFFYNRIEAEGKAYLDMLKSYLDDNADTFPAYSKDENFTGRIKPEDGDTMLWL